jgi:hypothetical protein
MEARDYILKAQEDRMNHIVDSFSNADELLKAEGSRGGKIIGHTKAGKPIYEGKDVKTSLHATLSTGTKLKAPVKHKDRDGYDMGGLDAEKHQETHKNLTKQEHAEAAKHFKDVIVPHYQAADEKAQRSGGASSSAQNAWVKHSDAKDLQEWHEKQSK